MLKVSVITVVYNNQHHMEDCIRSVLSQTYTSVEYIVLDGQSTDGTCEIIRNFTDKIAVFKSEPDQGMYDALNKGIQMATGDIIGVLHSDDLFGSVDTLKHIVHCFEDQKCEAVYGNLEYTDREDPDRTIRFWRSRAFQPGFLWQGWMPPHPTLFVRKHWFEKIGGYRTDFRISADYDFVLRLFSQSGFHSFFLDEVITLMRSGGASNGSLKNVCRKSREDLIAIRENRIGGLMTLFLKNVRKVVQFIHDKNRG